MSAGEIAGITIEAALEQVRLAFAERTMPVHATYCPCCHDDEEMQRLLHSLPADIPGGELNFRILWDAYWTGIDWPSLAYYIPEMLARVELYGDIDEDMLAHKLLLAGRRDEVEASGSKVSGFLGEGMNEAEKEAVGAFFQFVLDERLHTLSYHEHRDMYRELFAFLIYFDYPAADFLERWKQADDPQARVNLCLFVMDYLLNYSDGRRFITGSYYDRSVEPTPENQAALDALLAPESAANFLMNCAEDAETAGPDWETGIGAAFDWAVTLAQRKAGHQ